MSIEIFLMVLSAALVHATWNALVKSDGDRLGLIKVMFRTQFVLSVCLVPVVATPAPESWPYLTTSAVLSVGYMLFLNWAYQVGDLSHVYPFARGIAPAIVAVVSVGFLGERLSHLGQIAVVLITLGVTSLALTRGKAGLRDPRPVLLALGTGGFIAAYTITDALGARSAGTPHGYMVWVSLLWAILMAGTLHVLQRGKRVPLSERSRRAGIVAGIMSYGSSWLVIWALTLAPMALVSALRETSIVFAVIIGVVFLHESLSLVRLASIATTLIGTTVLKMSR
jgi:drug/metabolite transporter (DMT)-like permease